MGTRKEHCRLDQRSGTPNSVAQAARAKPGRFIAAYPIEYRGEILVNLPPETQSRLWATQLQRFLDENARVLTPEQRVFLETTIPQVTPEAYAASSAPFDLCETIATLFPDKEHRKVFREIGANASPAGGPGATLVALGEQLRVFNVPSASSAAECNCNGEGWCECPWEDECMDTGCVGGGHTCGCIGSSICEKRCVLQGF